MDLLIIILKANSNRPQTELMESVTFCKLREMIGADTAQYVYLENNFAMMVDEEGLLKDRTVNPMASRIAGIPIVGDAVCFRLTEAEDIPYK